MSNFQEHTGFLPAILWQGQIVDDPSWKGNTPGTKFKNPVTDIPGFGFRYRVRIFGRDTSNKNDLPDNQLEMASVLYPVTGGSGHAGSFQTPNLRKGALVIGYYADGTDGREPVILGTYGNNDQIKLSQTIPLTGFTPYSGYIGEQVAGYSIPPGGSPPANGTGAPQEGAVAQGQNGETSADQLMMDDGGTKTPLKSPYSCKDTNVTETKLKIENLQKDILKAQKFVNSWVATIEKPIKYKGQQLSLEEYVAIKLQEATKAITKSIKDQVEKIRKFAKEQLEKKKKKTYQQSPNKLPEENKKSKILNKLFDAIFDKIIDKLPAMILGFLKDAFSKGAGKIINVPECASENIIGGLLGSIAGFITSSVKKIVKPIASLANTALGLVSDILGFIKGLLGYACPEVTEWSWWNGAISQGSGLASSAKNIFEKAKKVASEATEVIDPDNYKFDIDIKKLANPTGCNTDPQPCGPPKVAFFGGNPVVSAAANVIISSTGEVIGVDLINKGIGYKKEPIVSVEDDCGNGKGANVKAIMKETDPDPNDPDTPLYEVEKVIVVPDASNNPDSNTGSGSGYLQTPDGSTGGNGIIFAGKCDSTIKKSDGTWDKPYEKGEIMNIEVGDTVKLPGQIPYVSQIAETITAPGCVEEDQEQDKKSSTSTGQTLNDKTKTEDEYTVTLSMCEVYVTNPGINYDKNDELVIEPANGAKGEIVVGDFGSIEKINMTQCGLGYTEAPTIYIKTQTGYNVGLSPVFTVETVENIAEVPAELQGSLISVIDCVGKF